MKTTVHIISHSHWDREWYMPFEAHRKKLVELIDSAMELFEQDPEFKSFHLDGQTIVLDDYLEIKPQNAEKLKRYIREGRFVAGPWYVLQDEFLTGPEANVRNLLVGRKEAEAFGKCSRVGYFPDAFGNAGQMPQLLKQAGMEAIAFGRGVRPVGFNNEVEEGEYDSRFSEMMWEAPDGSALPGILFANWYNNGAEIPVEEEAARRFWDEALKNARRFAGTSQLLLMNGCDHQPVQRDLSAALRTARRLYPDTLFIHSDFPTYVKAVREEMQGRLSTVRGELTSQETDGRYTLANTASCHIPLKQDNRACESALVKEAEPAAAMALICGHPYPEDMLRYSWRELMQNHPHDSICNCSVDAVNEEMKLRYDKSRQVSKLLYGESLVQMSEQIDCGELAKRGLPFAVWNTTGWKRSGMVSVVLDVERSYGGELTKKYEELESHRLPDFVCKDASGNVVEARIEDLGTKFGYDLPDDRFRKPYMARQVRVSFTAEEIPALGYRVWYLEEAKCPEASIEEAASKARKTSPACMENEFLRVEVAENGSYRLTVKKSGKVYPSLGVYEDTGDIGNEYIYVQDAEGKVLTTKALSAQIEKCTEDAVETGIRITQVLPVPRQADERLIREQKSCVEPYERKAGRCRQIVPLKIVTYLSLRSGDPALHVETTIENTAMDHRVRVLFPTGFSAEKHFADGCFEVVERNNRHGKNWTNPSGCDRQQDFVAMEDGETGLLLANRGLYEYEVLPEQDNAMALTLLRCVGEMGDWGDFPTPKAQLPGSHTLSYALYPYERGERAEAFAWAHQYQTDPTAVQIFNGNGMLPLCASFLTWQGSGLALSAFKKADENNDLILRYVNETGREVPLTLQRQDWMKGVSLSNVVEEDLGEVLPQAEGSYHFQVKPHEIFTLLIRR